MGVSIKSVRMRVTCAGFRCGSGMTPHYRYLQLADQVEKSLQDIKPNNLSSVCFFGAKVTTNFCFGGRSLSTYAVGGRGGVMKMQTEAYRGEGGSAKCVHTQ